MAVEGRRRSAPVLSEEEVLARTESFNRAAEDYWKDVLAEPSARRHVHNKPFGSVTDAPGMLYRLGLLLSELRLGLGHTVLDFGCGSGWLSSCLNRLGCSTIAVDVSPTALELGRELLRLDPRHRPELEPRFLPYDGHRLPLPDASVDRVACFDAFHHVPNQDEVLAELHRVLRPGGRAVLAEPGEGHSHSECSTFETDRYGVLENEIDVLDLERRARRAGFTGVVLKPYPDPDALRVSPAEYAALMDGDVRAFPVDALARSLRNFFVVTLAKGEERRDSRNPGRLLATLGTSAPDGGLRGLAGSTVAVLLTIRNDGDTTWLHEENAIGGYVLLSGHLVDASGQIARHGFFRERLPRAVGPGESVDVVAGLPLPLEAGRYVVRFDLVDEHVMWFAQAGSTTLDVPLEVEASANADGLRARIEVREGAPLQGAGGTELLLRLRVANEGREPWPHAPEPRPHTVSLAAHLLDAAGGLHARDVLHQPLPRTIAPGEAVDLDVPVRAPQAPGRYRLKVDLVLEHVCWFEQRGSAPLELPLVVTDEVPDSAHPGLLRASLERLTPGVVRVSAGGSFPLRYCATNLGNTRWLHAARPGGGHVALGAHLLDERRATIDFDYLRAGLPRDVEPGETVESEVTVPAPAPPGRYVLEIDLVDEGLAWFASFGSPTVTVAIEVTSGLADELVRMEAYDQEVRAELAADGSLFDQYHPHMEAVHRAHAARLREIVAEHGWPGESLVGAEGAHAAWLIVQHSIGEPRFMRACHALLDQASQRGDVPRWQFALLDDRIAVFEGRPQRFGSQLREGPEGLTPYPLADPSRVDEWRRELGLTPLAEVIARSRSSPPPAPRDRAGQDEAEKEWRRRVGWIGEETPD